MRLMNVPIRTAPKVLSSAGTGNSASGFPTGAGVDVDIETSEWERSTRTREVREVRGELGGRRRAVGVFSMLLWLLST